ncbi:peptide chain release factor N(5)-glutamine methyltransferase [Aestuariivirga litoralis]|uniref:Release factor glutamine methyltransferase n=1 Tax=Aestuariivirga litoralis TaxID=2650924 RepID=A0A2W2AI83_9HYPH|nr:peptide chain release factor N(5)-glutamine methyltransferase [Aestuariivirga litoralis]PZF75165.1 peptide chain release factor N(5)-glutamine methyltransferase [Aestuariivirga litoralis]
MPPDQLASLLAAASARLKAAGSDTPVLDARLLLQAAAGFSREDLIMGPDCTLSPGQAARFESFIARREEHEPVSRILGEREFYGRAFKVTPDTLDPRPDTETIIEAALPRIGKGARLLDLGTGTGAIAITLLAERPESTGVATDLSPAALAVAGENARALGVADRLTLLEGSWLEPVTGAFDIILSNPPYIPAGDIATLSPDVRNHDPGLALVGGTDGLDPYRIIASGAAAHLAAGGHVLVEIGAGQAEDITAIFTQHGFRAAGRYRDLGGHERCLAFNRPEK